ncbi:DUF3160 domain-containing protein [Clostridiaceae bacterium M8S5]|nr:DUF3160 domain-containing protein [Clostridiaceae bacterium M8S5]
MFRKIISILLCFVILFISTTGCNKDKVTTNVNNNKTPQIKERKKYTLETKNQPTRDSISVTYTVPNYNAKVKPYKIKSDLSNIVNVNQFGKFTRKQKALLCKNGFVVTPRKSEQLFHIYEYNEYSSIPSFITTDSVLQTYHVFYGHTLRKLEKEIFLKDLEALTKSMLMKSAYLYNKVNSPYVKKLLEKNITYFTVAYMLLDKNDFPKDAPTESIELAKKEIQLIEKHEGVNKSVLFPYQLDYSQYKPRGHYTRTDELKRYFKVMMWYGQAPFPLYVMKNDETVKSKDQTVQALLMTYSMFLVNYKTDDIKLWENIYDITNFYVGSSDDLNIYQYKDILIKVFGKNPDINDFEDDNKLNEVYEEAKKLPEPKIKNKFVGYTIPVGKQFRFMGQRYTPDAEVLQRLCEPLKRPIPSAIDVMGVLGSKRALDIQTNINKVPDYWERYAESFNKLKDEFEELEESKWQSNMYYGWLWTLKGLLKEFNEGYPSFMTNVAWQDKSLITSMSSWAELKHDTVLYGKQSGAECGGFDEPPTTSGYVEPNIDVYNKLLWLTKYSKENLKHRNILSESTKENIGYFEDLLKFLIKCSVKELNNENLTEIENERIRTYGGWLESLTLTFIEDGLSHWYEITSDADKNMACIADIHTSKELYLEAGVGPAYEIYVVVPVGDKLQLNRGAVFNYNEFISPKRLTDEEWQQMIKDDKVPEQEILKWIDSFFVNQPIKNPNESTSRW